VRFDQTEVTPAFHGSGTLLVDTPEHTPGQVVVTVSNDSQNWSSQSAVFTYEQPLDTAFINVSVDYRSQMDLGASVDQNSFDPFFFNNPLGFSGTGRLDSSNGAIPRFLTSRMIDLFVGPNATLELAARILQEFPQIVTLRDQRGFSLLHYVACLDRPFFSAALIRMLIHSGFDPNEPDDGTMGLPPLHWSILSCLPENAETLLEMGANGNTRSTKRSSHFASPLECCIVTNQISFLPSLLRAKASPFSRNHEGATALHLAAALGLQAFVLCLYKIGAALRVRDHSGDTALHWAVRESQIATANLLIRLGLSVFCLNEDQETPLHLALLDSSSSSSDLSNPLLSTLLETQSNVSNTSIPSLLQRIESSSSSKPFFPSSSSSSSSFAANKSGHGSVFSTLFSEIMKTLSPSLLEKSLSVSETSSSPLPVHTPVICSTP